MVKWEYKIVAFRTGKAISNWEEDLNELGKQNWELIAVIPLVASIGAFGSTPEVRCFLKRKRK